jgi:hypothetical protein
VNIPRCVGCFRCTWHAGCVQREYPTLRGMLAACKCGAARSGLWLRVFEVWRPDFEIGEAGGAQRIGQPVGIPDYYKGELIGMDD